MRVRSADARQKETQRAIRSGAHLVENLDPDLGRAGRGPAYLIIAEQLLTLMLPKTGHPIARQNRPQHQCQDPHQHSPKVQVVQRKT